MLIGRLTPLVRSFVSLPAGAMRQPLGRYTVLTFIGSTVWCIVFAGIGWGVGASYTRFNDAFRYVEILVALGVVALAAWVVLRWWKKRTR